MALDNPLPNGWKWTTLGKLANYINGHAFKPSDWGTKGRPIIRIQNLTGSSETLNRYSGNVEERYLIRDSDLLISWSATLGVFVYRGEEAVLNQHIFKVEPYVNKIFLYYLVMTFLDTLKRQVHGSGMQHITKGKFDDSPVPLPPLHEQERIVERIERLFTQLDAGAAGLKRAQAALKRYHASVLKAACEGRLVPQDPSDEPAEELVRRLGKSTLVGDNLLSLPDGWCWTKVGDLSRKIQYGTSEKASLDSSGIPVLRMGNVNDGQLGFINLKYLPNDTPGLKDLILDEGDLIFNRTNSAELVGKTAVYKISHPKATFASYLIRVKFYDPYLPYYVSFYINSLQGRKYIASVVSQQVGQANVNGTKLANMPIPLPPLAEQRRIVAEMERQLSIVEEIETVVESALARAARLRQAILKRAFEGRLVEQNPQDEPAEKLLARIRGTPVPENECVKGNPPELKIARQLDLFD